jgi:flagellar protein FlbD
VIVLHRLGHEAEPFHLNPDLILTVEALPDTVVALTTGAKVVVAESPIRVAELVRAWRSGILTDALRRRRDEPLELPHPAIRAERPALTAIEGTPPPVDHLG